MNNWWIRNWYNEWINEWRDGLVNIEILVGFGLACAPVRCAHPSFWAHCHAKRGAARPPPIAASLLHIHWPKNLLFPETKASFRPSSGRQGRISFHWTTEALKYNIPRPTCRTLLSYAAPYWASLHPKEICCTLLSYVASSWATMHPTKLHCTLLS
jgi:hypothetical protein